MAPFESKTDHQAAICDDSKPLNLIEISVFRSTVQLGLHSGAVPNEKSTNLCGRLQPHRHSTKWRV